MGVSFNHSLQEIRFDGGGSDGIHHTFRFRNVIRTTRQGISHVILGSTLVSNFIFNYSLVIFPSTELDTTLVGTKRICNDLHIGVPTSSCVLQPERSSRSLGISTATGDHAGTKPRAADVTASSHCSGPSGWGHDRHACHAIDGALHCMHVLASSCAVQRRPIRTT